MSEPLARPAAPTEPKSMPWLGIGVNLLTSVAVSIAMGMLAVIVPVSLEERDFSKSAIGLLLSLETLASIAVCFALILVYRRFGMLGSLWFSTLPRLGGLVLLAISDHAALWALGIVLHGLGTYGFLLITQTWINALPFRQSMGLWMAIYSTIISVGFAVGPVVLNLLTAYETSFIALTADVLSRLGTPIESLSLTVALLLVVLLIHLLATLPLAFAPGQTPALEVRSQLQVLSVIRDSKGPMCAIALAGVSYFGVSAFIVVYGMQNGLTQSAAALMLTFFSLGSICLEVPLGYVSDRLDRRFVLVGCAFCCMICAAYLPIVIDDAHLAWLLVFLWGGVVGAIYSISLALIGERFTGERLLAANSAYSILEGLGGTLGVLSIGFAMDFLGSDGLPYIIMFASILFFCFALTRYRVV